MSVKMPKLRLMSTVAALAAATAVTAGPGSVTAESDNWMLTDGLGRKARTYEQAGARHTDRFVGMFYWTWHQGYDFDGGADPAGMEIRNITEVLRDNPDAINT